MGETFADEWPRFYQSGESTHPTTQILNNLTFYHAKWKSLQSEDFGQTYAFTMSWDCGSQCTECLKANKFIQVEDNSIISLQTSALNDNSKLLACDSANDTMQISEYKSIDDLYQMVINWVQSGLASSDISDYTIHELLLHKTYFFPIAVKLSDREYIAWNIVCFEPDLANSEDDVCDFTVDNAEDAKQQKFWINEKMQAWLGWSCIFLILVACSLEYCINWLKKKKAAKIEAWRQREEENQKKKEEKEKLKKKKRKSSKVKHRAHLERNKRQRQDAEHEYSKVNVVEEPVVSNLN